ncbi:MAG TPA: hypothetical protein VJB65_01080, partial [Patescibacteria group bacterium]|nr:hypothetical protein [Patescibacteria group bacterium]
QLEDNFPNELRPLLATIQAEEEAVVSTLEQTYFSIERTPQNMLQPLERALDEAVRLAPERMQRLERVALRYHSFCDLLKWKTEPYSSSAEGRTLFDDLQERPNISGILQIQIYSRRPLRLLGGDTAETIYIRQQEKHIVDLFSTLTQLRRVVHGTPDRNTCTAEQRPYIEILQSERHIVCKHTADILEKLRLSRDNTVVNTQMQAADVLREKVRALIQAYQVFVVTQPERPTVVRGPQGANGAGGNVGGGEGPQPAGAPQGGRSRGGQNEGEPGGRSSNGGAPQNGGVQENPQPRGGEPRVSESSQQPVSTLRPGAHSWPQTIHGETTQLTPQDRRPALPSREQIRKTVGEPFSRENFPHELGAFLDIINARRFQSGISQISYDNFNHLLLSIPTENPWNTLTPVEVQLLPENIVHIQHTTGIAYGAGSAGNGRYSIDEFINLIRDQRLQFDE